MVKIKKPINIECDTKEMGISLAVAAIQKISEDFLREKLKNLKTGKFDINLHLECNIWELWKEEEK